MGKFKELEIPENESENKSISRAKDPLENCQNLTLFDDDSAEPIPGYSMLPRYLADVKAWLEFIDVKVKQQRSKPTQARAA